MKAAAFDENASQTIKNLANKISELEKQIRSKSLANAIDQLNKELGKIQAELKTKAPTEELNSTKHHLTAKYDHLLNEMNKLNAKVEELMRGGANMSVLMDLKSKYDQLKSDILGIKNNDESYNQYSHKPNHSEGNYLTIGVFNTFKTENNNSLEKIKKDISDIYATIEDLKALIASKASPDDLTKLEGKNKKLSFLDKLIKKIENLREGCELKYADKNKMHRKHLYYDQQVNTKIIPLDQTNIGYVC